MFDLSGEILCSDMSGLSVSGDITPVDLAVQCEPASFPSIPHFFCSFFPSFIPHVLPSTFLFVALPDSFSQ